MDQPTRMASLERICACKEKEIFPSVPASCFDLPVPASLLEACIKSCAERPEVLREMKGAKDFPVDIYIKIHRSLARMSEKTTYTTTSHQFCLGEHGTFVLSFTGDAFASQVSIGSAGHLYLVPGKTFYSTNCEQVVSLALPNLHDVNIEELLQTHLDYVSGITLDCSFFKKKKFKITPQLTTLAVVVKFGLRLMPVLRKDPFAGTGSNTLVKLDLRGKFKLGDMNFLSQFPNLQWLSLSDKRISDFTKLHSLKYLKFLDISHCGTIPKPAQVLRNLLDKLLLLEYLDISFTNLDAKDLQGLCEVRRRDPLKVLGLYRTKHNGCQMANLPAEVVSGDATVEQCIAALRMYTGDRRQMDVLNREKERLQWSLVLDFSLDFIRRKTALPFDCSGLHPALVILADILEEHLIDMSTSAQDVTFNHLMDFVRTWRSHTIYRDESLESLLLLLSGKLSDCLEPSYFSRLLPFLCCCVWEEDDWRGTQQILQRLADGFSSHIHQFDKNREILRRVNETLRCIAKEILEKETNLTKQQQMKIQILQETAEEIFGELEDDNHVVNDFRQTIQVLNECYQCSSSRSPRY